MRCSTSVFAFCLATLVVARPIPQGAGIGAGCDSIFSDTDTTIGDLVESEGSSIGKQLGSNHAKRQGAGIGAGCNSIFSDTDTTLGDFVQSEGEQIGKELGGASSGNAGNAGGTPAPPPPGPKQRRQANGIGYGIQDVVEQLPGMAQPAADFGSEVNTIDGDTTNGSADLGKAVGDFELAAGQSLETMTGAQDSYSNGGAHSSRTKRQANGIGYGIQDVVQELPGLAQPAANFGDIVNTIDGETTDGSAALGKAVGEGELAVGQALETATGAEDSYSHGGAHSS